MTGAPQEPIGTGPRYDATESGRLGNEGQPRLNHLALFLTRVPASRDHRLTDNPIGSPLESASCRGRAGRPFRGLLPRVGPECG